MAKTTGGVEIRAASIRLTFTAGGVRYRRTLMIDGSVVLPTPANIKYANRLIVEICKRIKSGTFNLVDYFAEEEAPASAVPPRVAARTEPEMPIAKSAWTKRKSREHTPAELTRDTWLVQWLAMTRIETSTRRGYSAAVKFWTDATCDNRGRQVGSVPLA